MVMLIYAFSSSVLQYIQYYNVRSLSDQVAIKYDWFLFLDSTNLKRTYIYNYIQYYFSTSKYSLMLKFNLIMIILLIKNYIIFQRFDLI